MDESVVGVDENVSTNSTNANRPKLLNSMIFFVLTATYKYSCLMMLRGSLVMAPDKDRIE